MGRGSGERGSVEARRADSSHSARGACRAAHSAAKAQPRSVGHSMRAGHAQTRCVIDAYRSGHVLFMSLVLSALPESVEDSIWDVRAIWGQVAKLLAAKIAPSRCGFVGRWRAASNDYARLGCLSGPNSQSHGAAALGAEAHAYSVGWGRSSLVVRMFGLRGGCGVTRLPA